MRDDLTGLLEMADLALGSAADVVDRETLEPLIESVRAVRSRLSYPEDVLVVALAGGTGSGKSSLFNALAGEDLAETGGVRPTTSHPAVAVPESVGGTMDGYLDRLGIVERHSFQGPRLCLIDLPDTDSVEESHRLRVDRVLPLVDVVSWVTDPQKYRDARLHHDYLKPLAAYAGQFIFVLNQIDRLDPSEVWEVRSDLVAALDEDGFPSPVVLTVAAAPPAGPPMGLEELYQALEEKREGGRALYGKLLADIAGASRSLEARAGAGLDFDARAREALDSAVRALSDGDTTEANRVLTGLVDALAGEAGGDTAEKLERLGADVPGHVARIEREATQIVEPRWKWPWRRRHRSALDLDQARDLIAEAVIRPARAVMARRAVAIAAVTELAIVVERLRQTTDR